MYCGSSTSSKQNRRDSRAEKTEQTPSLVSDVFTSQSLSPSVSPQTNFFHNLRMQPESPASLYSESLNKSLPNPLGFSMRRNESNENDTDDAIALHDNISCSTTYFSTNQHGSFEGISQAAVRRPITPPSPRPRSSWCMPGSTEDLEFWAAYEEKQKIKAAAKQTMGKKC